MFEREGMELEIAEAAASLLEQSWSSAARRAWLANRAFPPHAWQQGAATGWFDVLVEEAAGGLGLGPVAACAIAEAAGRALLPGPLVDSMVLAPLPHPVCVLRGAQARMRSGVVSGTGLAADWADAARRLVVDAGDVIVAVDPADVGVKVAVGESLDQFRQPCSVDLMGAAVFEVVAEGAAVSTWRARTRSLGLVIHASILLGVAGAALDMAVAYAGARRQFDRPIAAFQAVQHRLADMKVLVESLRSAGYRAQIALRDGPPDEAAAHAVIAKAHASAVAREVLEDALQVHAGIGFTADHDLSLYMLHGLTLQTALGDERTLRRELGLQALSGRTTTRREAEV